MTRTINGLDELKSLVGEHLGYSPYIEITQDQVNLFADATGDHQWIHVDVERAAAGPMLSPQIYQVSGISMGVNYGCEKVRFPAPVPVGSKLRLGAELLSVDDVPGGVQVNMEYVFEVEGASKPSCVAEVVTRLYV
jgi:acyl dehydratase